MDRDFWWHIKAGEIMFMTRHIISIEPFAYTREGLPYLASYEWLSQILLYLIYKLGGPTGIILLRGVVACSSVGLLLLLSKQKRLAYVMLAVWAVVITKGSFLERPQLFTFLFFTGFLLLAFRFLDAEWRTRIKISLAFILLDYVWVNMHGGAALLGCFIVGLVFLQSVFVMLRSYDRREHMRTIVLLIGTMALMVGSLFLPPNGTNAIHYVTQLLSDKTILFIAEFQPRAWALYLKEFWPFYVLSIAALLTGRKHWVFNSLLLIVTAYLSRQAFRHEIFFIFAAIGTCFYQCDRSERFTQLGAWLKNRPKSATGLVLITVLFLSWSAYHRSFGFERQDNLFGFGQFDLARGAYEFVEREKITGNMFNTYGIGGYLLNRGYPNRKVFIDGRNVDYGFEFMARAYAAGVDADRWEELEHRHDITYAIVDYDAIKQKDRLPYSAILDKDTDWALVYLDDWVAVYLKKIPENQPIIERLQYNIVNATMLEFDDFADISAEDIATVMKELERVQTDNPQGVKATIALAKIAFREQRLEDVKALVKMARTKHPGKPEPLALLAATFIRSQEWDKAADAYTELLRLAGNNYPDMNYGYVADIFEKAGQPWKAWYYRLGLPKIPSSEKNSGSGAQLSSAPSLSVNPALDALEFSERGLTQAEAGQFVEAEESFRTSLKINPGNAEAWNNFCALLLNLHKEEEALEACRKATEIDAEYGDAHYNLALTHYKMGSMKEAEAEALLAKKWGRQQESDELLLLIKKYR